MKKDYLQTLETAGYTARIKRISDGIMYDSRKVYASLNLNIEPNWHLIFLLLKQEKKMTVTQIAEALGFSHPAIIKIVKKMKLLEYLESETDTKDSRKQLIKLTKKSLLELPKLEEEWEKIKKVLDTIFDEDIIMLLKKLEEKLAHKSLFQTYIDYYKIEDNSNTF